MLSKILPAPLVGVLTSFMLITNTIFWSGPILIFALVKALIPVKVVTTACNRLLNTMASTWITANVFFIRVNMNIQWDVALPENLSTREWYLVTANHQSWVDIFALQRCFNRKIPFLKFFLKQELFWVPLLGLAWWALDFPFMKRYTKSYLKKNPHKKGKDFETTQQACEKFKSTPISIMNFAEGTRFTTLKQQRQNSPYANLLKPKSGGIGYVLALMGNEIRQIVDVTISYPENEAFSFWEFLCGKVTRIKLHAQVIEIPEEVSGNYIEDSNTRIKLQQWLNQIWQKKDKQLMTNDS